jgi:imidazole glycerol-phosphate synthase subunit HisH
LHVLRWRKGLEGNGNRTGGQEIDFEMLAIIDYGSGNIAALTNIFRQRKVPHFVSGEPRELAGASHYLLPGVGAFDPTMETLTRSGVLDVLTEAVIGKGKRVLGICVGMQLLAEASDEGQMPGLGWIKGRVRKIDISRLNQAPLLPHMGWNSVCLANRATLFDGIDVGRGFYFMHSYYFDAAAKEDVSAHVTYGSDIPCAVERGNVFGAQFHPEKSHSNGMRFLLNYAELA